MMERIFKFFLISMLSLQAAESGQASQGEPTLHVTKQQLAQGFYLYIVSMNDGQQELGKIQFKFYDTERRPKSAEIDYLLIPEDKRNEGNGDKLLKRTLDMMSKLKCVEVKTNIDSANEHSLYLFEKNGFSREGSSPHVMDAETVRMNKRL